MMLFEEEPQNLQKEKSNMRADSNTSPLMSSVDSFTEEDWFVWYAVPDKLSSVVHVSIESGGKKNLFTGVEVITCVKSHYTLMSWVVHLISA